MIPPQSRKHLDGVKILSSTDDKIRLRRKWEVYLVQRLLSAHGGHVVNFSLREGELRYCYANDFQIRLPDPATLSGLNLARDWSAELKRAEAER